MRFYGLFRITALLAGSLVFGNLVSAQSALWFPLATVDLPDLNGIDSNQDGIDGMRLGPIFVSAQFGNDSNVGSINAPLRTLPMAMCVAQQLGGRAIYADTSGFYKTVQAPFPNTRLFGGFVKFSSTTNAWSRSGRSTVDALSPLTFYVRNVGDEFTVQNFEIRASAGPTGRPSVGIYIWDTSPLGSLVTLTNCVMTAGTVSAGPSGANGANGADGISGGKGGDGQEKAVFFTAVGGVGGTSAGSFYQGSGGSGGDASGDVVTNGQNGSSWDTRRGDGGVVGSGRDATAGVDVTFLPPNAGNGGRQDDYFLGTGGDGLPGAAGDGAGGGGGGAGRGDITNLSGAGGGGGGQGGRGGAGGKGGQVGPSSIGVIWRNTALSQLDVSGSTITTQNGGKGGNGGNGGIGGAGGLGGDPGKPGTGAASAGKGGRGGNGGFGAGGGAGAGGRGGSSIGIVYTTLPNQPIETIGTTFSLGVPGVGGAGGNSVSRDFTSTTAPSGLGGIAAWAIQSANLPGITGAASDTHFLQSTARLAVGIGGDVEFAPAIMTADGDLTDYQVKVVNSLQGRGKLSSSGVKLRYQANYATGPTPYYDEVIAYQVWEPTYTIINGVKTRTGTVIHECTGIVSVLRQARVMVNLGDWSGAKLSGPQNFELANRSDVALPAPLNFSNGDSALFLIPNGDATLRFKTWHWLGQKATPVADQLGNVSYTFNLINGDIDGDNQTTIVDYSIFSDYFDRRSSDSGWLTVGVNGFRPVDADLDGDGEVSIVDYSIFSDNYDHDGE